MLCFLHAPVSREWEDRDPWVQKEKLCHSREEIVFEKHGITVSLQEAT